VSSFTAQVAEVLVAAGRLKMRRVVCAVDCGQAVYPSGDEQQNFHHTTSSVWTRCPAVEVHLVNSPNNPGGIEEAGTPSTVPAVVNGIYAATRKRIRNLPLRVEHLA
jgi:isoquinoline 1-oxidoreductase beta subunit